MEPDSAQALLYAARCKSLFENVLGPLDADDLFANGSEATLFQKAVKEDLRHMVDMSQQGRSGTGQRGVGRSLGPRPTAEWINPTVTEPVALLDGSSDPDHVTAYPFQHAGQDHVLASWVVVMGDAVFDLYARKRPVHKKIAEHREWVRDRILRNFNQQRKRLQQNGLLDDEDNYKRRKRRKRREDDDDDVDDKRRKRKKTTATDRAKRAERKQRQEVDEAVVLKHPTPKLPFAVSLREDMRPMGTSLRPAEATLDGLVSREAMDDLLEDLMRTVFGRTSSEYESFDLVPAQISLSPKKGPPPPVHVSEAAGKAPLDVYASPQRKMRVYHERSPHGSPRRRLVAVSFQHTLYVPQQQEEPEEQQQEKQQHEEPEEQL